MKGGGMKNRSRIEIIGQILETANGCSSSTQIMYKAFLSYARAKEYVKSLTDNGFLRYDLTSQGYRITEKGIRFLQLYSQIDEVIDLFQQPELQQKYI
jgi:predicted transcriptional regulator